MYVGTKFLRINPRCLVPVDIYPLLEHDIDEI